MISNAFLVFGLLTLTLFLNVWVWFLPNSFLDYLKLAKDSMVSNWPSQRELWKLLENPRYIWLPRIVFGLALIVITLTAYYVLTT